MQNNCLVTKLNGVVSNDNLEKLGVITLYTKGTTYFGVKATENNQSVIHLVDNITKFVPGGAGVIDEDNKYVSSTYEVNVLTPIDSSKVMVFEIYNKYYLENIENVCIKSLESLTSIPGLSVIILSVLDLVVSTVHCNLSDLNKIQDKTKLTRFRFSGIANYETLHGNINVFSAFTNLTDLRLTTVGIDGDIKDIGNLTSLTELNTQYTFIEGNLEEFVQAQRTAGRTTNSEGIKLLNNSSYIKFNNELIWTVSNEKLTWTASTITYNGITVNA